MLQQYLPFTVLKLQFCRQFVTDERLHVATVLTVYGIETRQNKNFYAVISVELQQYLPFTVLKQLKIRL